MADIQIPKRTNKEKEDLISQVIEMMAIPGKSGEEAEIAEYIRNQLIQAGADPKTIRTDSAHRRTRIKGNVGNLVFKLPGTYKAPRRMLSAHLDTVPICEGCRPKRTGMKVTSIDKDTGLGADNRAGCGVVLSTALEILSRGLPHPPLTFTWFVQEEVGLQGSRHATISLFGNPELAFNWDGGSPVKMTIGATGGYRMTINVRGIASHAGVCPERGVSAIAITALAIADLQQRGWHGAIKKGKQTGTSNVGIVQGGDATNVVTDHVYVRAEARSHNANFRKRIVREIEGAFKRAVKKVKSVQGERGSVEIEGFLDYDSFKLGRNEPCVKIASNVIKSLNHEPLPAIADGGLDANWVTKHGVPTVSMGCGQLNAHMVTETLNLKEYLIACDIGLAIALGFEG
ncbi:MAG: M20/M25/M40 family metallo-hydrolase [Planctomycetota bacterium]|nr:M20/M25/M40 family metallo-hydrolase [Planctomycetota bacterium]